MSAQLTEALEVRAARDQVISVLAAGGSTPLTLQQVKAADPLPEYYTEVTVIPMYLPAGRNTGHQSLNGIRIGTRVVASIEDTAYDEAESNDAALRNARLEISGATTTPVKFESADEIGDDNGRWSGLTTWTTAIKNRRAS